MSDIKEMWCVLTRDHCLCQSVEILRNWKLKKQKKYKDNQHCCFKNMIKHDDCCLKYAPKRTDFPNTDPTNTHICSQIEVKST